MADNLINIRGIRTDGDTQARVSLNDPYVEELSAVVEAGEHLPPVVVFDDGKAKWLADGFHTIAAYLKAGKAKVPAKIRNGTQRDARLFAVGANYRHGLRRTNEDKRKAVLMVLAEEEWKFASDEWIAEKCRVSAELVARIRTKPDADTAAEAPTSDILSTSVNGSSSKTDAETLEEPAPPDPHEGKRQGKDGKWRPARHRSPPKAPPAEREPGDDTETEAASQNGQPDTDKAGHAIPAGLSAAFAAVAKFEEADTHTRALQKLIDEIARNPGGEQLARCTKPVGPEGKTIHKTEELQALHRHLRSTRPHSVCPWCKGKGNKTCKGCSGTGWVTKTTWDGAEKDVKEALCSS